MATQSEPRLRIRRRRAKLTAAGPVTTAWMLLMLRPDGSEYDTNFVTALSLDALLARARYLTVGGRTIELIVED